ncbi:MAG: hypothetical protein LBL94_12185 [Prevotellaceae bacterium]|jgi:hypothetical protein|nr:hypothetical protein [Prevotellaceae bacterium]
MLAVSSSDFKLHKVVAVPPDDDTLMTKEDFFAELELAKEEVRQGKYTTLKTREDIKAFLDSL